MDSYLGVYPKGGFTAVYYEVQAETPQSAVELLREIGPVTRHLSRVVLKDGDRETDVWTEAGGFANDRQASQQG